MKVVAVLLAVFIVFFLLCSVGIFHYQASFFDMGQQAVSFIGKIGDAGSSVLDFLFTDGMYTYLFVKNGVRYYVTSEYESAGAVYASNVSGASTFDIFRPAVLHSLYVYDVSGNTVLSKLGYVHKYRGLTSSQIEIWLDGGDLP